MKKKVAIVTYYWPPSGGAGVHRWLDLSNYLIDFGYEVTVVTSKNPDYPLIDTALSNKVNKQLNVVQVAGFEPRNLIKNVQKKGKENLDNSLEKPEKQSFFEKFVVYVRGNFFIPDARKSWAKAVAKYLYNHRSQFDNSLLITTGPPHSTHLIGLKWKKECTTPWIADFRDPWLEIEFFHQLRLTQAAKKKHAILEKKVLQSADLVTTVSPSWAELFRSKGAQETAVLFNASDYRSSEKVFTKSFAISYLGTLKSDRIPHTLIQAIANKCKKDSAFSTALQLTFMGNICEDLHDVIAAADLTKKTFFSGYVEHQDALKEMERADLLLLLQNKSDKNASGRIPMKFFEYINTANPIAIFCDPKSDLAHLANGIPGCFCLDYDDEETTASALDKAYSYFQQQEAINRSAQIAPFSRKATADKLHELITRLTIEKC
jgi:glycosyltransferase involved in cell wall biosynthesis